MEKVLKILSIEDEQSDYSFWMNKSYQERLDAVESMRLQYLYFNKGIEKQNVQPRLQRVLKVIKQK